MIPEGFITNLLDRVDIGDVIGRYVPLKKAGRNLMACCPFHKEKTPSFSVSPSKQIYKCFGCGASGNAIGFLMAYEGLEFPDAVRKLASFYGLEVPEDRSPAQARAREKQRTLTDYMSEAAKFYTEKLRGADRVIRYLKERAISGETAQKFALGYSPDEWHALKDVFKEKYDEVALQDCGLVNVKNDRRYDAFRGRLMFPIRNVKGQVIGFGARTLNGDEQPKYLNSPETPIYHKGSELYGLYEAREAIHKKGRAIVCEGYMDVIQLSQAGFTEAVAALGTSITSEHVHKLFKLADSVYFSFDGDGAGRKAAKRALESTLSVITDVQKAGFIILPPEHDPDSLIKAEGAHAYEAEIEKAYTLTGFLKHVLLEGKELMYAEERAKVVAEARPYVLAMQKAPILRLALIKELAGIARLTAEEIQRQYGLMPAVPRVSKPARFSQRNRWGSLSPMRPIEKRVRVKDMRERLLQCFLAYPELLSQFSAQIEEEFLTSEHPIAGHIISLWREAVNEDGGSLTSAAALIQKVKDPQALAYYRSLLSEELTMDTPREGATLEVRRTFMEMEWERIKARIEALAHEGTPHVAQFRPLVARRDELRRQIDEVAQQEREYRQRMDVRSRYERQEQLDKAGKGSTPALSSNPIIRELQEHLRGREMTTSSSSKAVPAQGAAMSASSALEASAPRSIGAEELGDSASSLEDVPMPTDDDLVGIDLSADPSELDPGEEFVYNSDADLGEPPEHLM